MILLLVLVCHLGVWLVSLPQPPTSHPLRWQGYSQQNSRAIVRKAVCSSVPCACASCDFSPDRLALAPTLSTITMYLLLLVLKEKHLLRPQLGSQNEIHLAHHQKKCQIRMTTLSVAKHNTGEKIGNLSKLPRHLPVHVHHFITFAQKVGIVRREVVGHLQRLIMFFCKWCLLQSGIWQDAATWWEKKAENATQDQGHKEQAIVCVKNH